jgi:DNA processing protein
MFVNAAHSGSASRREQAAVLALVKRTRGEWHVTADAIEAARSALRIVHGAWTGFEPEEVRASPLVRSVTEADLVEFEQLIEMYDQQGVRLVTVLDAEYPRNLRVVYNRPPFLWIRGTLIPADERSIAVVGTRSASSEGLAQAQTLAEQLARREVTVLSGLALGIDGAAHSAALDAGGRTVAVLGTGIDTIYPAAHKSLAEKIVESGGALVSQFWPSAPPTRWSFPMRNVVMSGMAIGTVVVEASKTSGAKMQARLALEHGKRLFLVNSLVTHEEWAQRYARHPGTTVVDSVDDVIDVLAALAQPVEQLVLG